MEILAVGVGGFVGAVARYGVSRLLSFAPHTAWSTLAVNVVGAFLLGLLMGTSGRWGSLSDPVRSFLIVGLLGSFTTFSTFSWEAIELFRSGQIRAGSLYILISLLLGLAAGASGYWLTRRVAA